MYKADLIEVVREKTGVSRRVAAESVNTVFDTIVDAVINDEPVSIKGFGTFTPKMRAARMCRNPQTGEPMQVAEARVPVFKVSHKFRDAVKAS
jgi:Bacterial nucleoid DNA-binding protein